MSNNISNNKRIAKNTLLLYVRMFLIMVIGLYTSRVVLQVLGVSDYGIYNVVGGFVSMLAYMNSVFVASTQRFISYTIGENDNDNLRKVFSTSVTVHWIIALLILCLSETFGLWFVNNKLVIDEGRMLAANWVYQCSIITLIINIISVPYNSLIIAHERMSVYAYISIFEVIMKLVIVYLLVKTNYDKLIVYSILLAIIAIIVRFLYTFYCKRQFKECHYEFIWDKTKIRQMSLFAGWTAVGTLGFTFKDQFINIMLNMFFGTTINAARGIANQVNGLVNQFSTNFFMAVTPQITKRYASGYFDSCRELVYSSARFSFYLMSLITIPLLINLRYILELWLDVVPQYTSEFLTIILISTLIGTISSSTGSAIQATGKIKSFQLGIAIIFLLELPLAYILLKAGYHPYIVVIPCIFTQIIGVFYRFYILQKQVNGYSILHFSIQIVGKSFVIFILCLFVCYFLRNMFNDSFITFIVSSIVSVLFTMFMIYVFGISAKERGIVNTYINKFLLSHIRKS